MKNRFLVLLLVGIGACEKKEVAPKASVSAPKELVSSQEVSSSVRQLLPLRSEMGKIAFVGRKLTGEHEGIFERFQGTLQFESKELEKSKLALDIELSSLKTDQAKLDIHLKSKDFFQVEQFPKATFESTEIKQGGTQGGSHTITGNLDLHGSKKSISFPANILVASDKITVKSEFLLNRKDFGVSFPGMPNNLIKDEVTVKIDLTIPRPVNQ